jgi:hypothetical protein
MKSTAALSLIVFSALLFLAMPAFADGTLRLDIPGVQGAGTLKKVNAEVYRVTGDKLEVVYQGSAFDLVKKGIDLSPGTYRVFIEDEDTGLIVPLDNEGQDFVLGENETLSVGAPELEGKVKKIKDKDKKERKTIDEKKGKGPPSTLAVDGEEEGGTGEEWIPGNLLIKFASGATLAERYQLIAEIGGEARDKLPGLGVYRVQVSEEADLEAIIAAYKDDPRVEYMEMNMIISISPPPVDEDTRRQ